MSKKLKHTELRQYADGELPAELLDEYPTANPLLQKNITSANDLAKSSSFRDYLFLIIWFSAFIVGVILVVLPDNYQLLAVILSGLILISIGYQLYKMDKQETQ